MTGACEQCLRRSLLVAALAPRIATISARRARPVPALLALAEGDLLAAVGDDDGHPAERLLDQFDASAERARFERAGVEDLCRHTAGYPGGLYALNDPPAVLYLIGGAARLSALLGRPAAAVVGSRRASAYGLGVAYELGRELGAAGATVVSGLALGIDAAAHGGSLDGGGGAVAVLAGGPDVPYPRRHRRLYERIRERGVILSEMPPGRPAYRWSFPARNRIMAGLAAMTVVVEAAEPSGSLITARFAADLGREVGAVPGLVTSARAAGSNALLRDGASVVRGAQDVLDTLFGAGAVPTVLPRAVAIGPESGRVLEAIEDGEGLERTGARSGLAAGEVRGALARLEGLGLVTRDGFGAWRRTGIPAVAATDVPRFGESGGPR